MPSNSRQRRPVKRYSVRRDKKVQRAAQWLVSALQHTWVPTTKLKAMAEAVGIKERTLERALAQPEIIIGGYKWGFESRRRGGRHGVWEWHLHIEGGRGARGLVPNEAKDRQLRGRQK